MTHRCFEFLVDFMVYMCQLARMLACALNSFEVGTYGTRVMVLSRDDDDTSFDHSSLAARLWTAFAYVAFRIKPLEVEFELDDDTIRMVRLYNATRILSKRQPIDECKAIGELRGAKGECFLATLNDDVDVSAFVNAHMGSLTPTNALTLRELLCVIITTHATLEQGKQLLMSIVKNDMTVKLVVLAMGTFKEATYGLDDVVAL